MKSLSSSRAPAFTLIEVMVSVAILAMIMVIVSTVIGQAQRSWRAASSRVTQFREARQAFETMSRSLRQAVLPTIVDFRYGTNLNENPATLTEQPNVPAMSAELGFRFGDAASLLVGGGGSTYTPGHAVMFQMPAGLYSRTQLALPENVGLSKLTRVLSPRGYFIRFGGNREYLPVGLASRLTEKSRYRLFEYRPTSAENTQVWDLTDTIVPDAWTTIPTTAVNNLVPVADNILILAFAADFITSGATEQVSLEVPVTNTTSGRTLLTAYNSYFAEQSRPPTNEYRNRLPRSMLVTMVAIDEETATRLSAEAGNSPHSPLGAAAGSLFSSAANLPQDLRSVRDTLTAVKANYRIFSSLVLIPGADTRSKSLTTK
jgi:uncharacterized protein (TIGR02599 family)